MIAKFWANPSASTTTDDRADHGTQHHAVALLLRHGAATDADKGKGPKNPES
jgi:hypothetical protein